MDIAKIRKKLKEKELEKEIRQGLRDHAAGVVSYQGSAAAPAPAAEDAPPAQSAPVSDTDAQAAEIEPERAGSSGQESPARAEEAREARTADAAEEPGRRDDECVPVNAAEAVPPPPADGAATEEPAPIAEFLVFTLAGEHYAFKLSELQEVIREQIVTFVPKMPPFIKGITSLRGKIIPVMALGQRLAIAGGRRVKKEQMIIVNGPRGPIGVLIDRVVGVRRIEASLITETPPHLDEEQANVIEAVVRDGEKFISILNTGEVLNFRAASLGRRTDGQA